MRCKKVKKDSNSVSIEQEWWNIHSLAEIKSITGYYISINWDVLGLKSDCDSGLILSP